MFEWERVAVASRGLSEPLLFNARVGTSDIKAIREVVEKRVYGRHGFTPKPGQIWMDFGANVGAFSIWAAAHGAEVAAFEPEPESFRMLETNVILSPDSALITPYNVGVWSEDKPARHLFSVNSARGNVWRSSAFHDWRGGHIITVDLEPVEPYWREEYCIKMDIEGAEMDILEAFGHRPVRQLVFEWSFDIDGDLARFRNVIAILQKTYRNVRGVPWKRVEGEHWELRGPANSALIYCWGAS